MKDKGTYGKEIQYSVIGKNIIFSRNKIFKIKNRVFTLQTADKPSF